MWDTETWGGGGGGHIAFTLAFSSPTTRSISPSMTKSRQVRFFCSSLLGNIWMCRIRKQFLKSSSKIVTEEKRKRQCLTNTITGTPSCFLYHGEGGTHNQQRLCWWQFSLLLSSPFFPEFQTKLQNSTGRIRNQLICSLLRRRCHLWKQLSRSHSESYADSQY